MSEIAAVIGANIKSARIAASLSLRELARLAGVSTQAVSTWENAEREIGAANLLALSEVLCVPVQILLGQQYEHPDTEQALAWWAGWREGWRQCADNARAAVTLRPELMPPRGRTRPVDDDPIEAQLQHLRCGAPPPDLSALAPGEREHVQSLLKIVTVLVDRDAELPPLEDDPVARRLGLVGDDGAQGGAS